MGYKEEYNKWINSEFVSEEDKKVLGEMNDSEIYEAFYKSAEFGTAGMRGIMGPGTNRLNTNTVRMASKGLAEYLQSSDEVKGTPSVAIAYDTRNNSESYAMETAKVLAAAGVKAYIFDRYSPVPLLSFAVRHLGCDGGVVITASHNTREYNGYKVYDNTGCQMSTEPAAKIAANMEALADPLNIATAAEDDANIIKIGDEVVEAFLEAINGCGNIEEDGYDAKAAAADLKVVYTSIHGSGRDFVMAALEKSGFANVKLTEEQAEFNGDFPTVAKPNPEDSAALRYAAKIAIEEGADIVIGTDPDCDRIGVGVILEDGNVRYLSGNQTGALLVNYLKGQGTLITTIVTSELGPIVAKAKGINVELTLTGFKYIGGIMNEMQAAGREDNFFMGYEESYGYLTGLHARDKDGVSAALAICKMAAYWKAQGKSLSDVLDSIYDEYGFWLDAQESFVYEGSEGEAVMKKIMEDLRAAGASIFDEWDDENKGTVEYIDYKEGIGNLPTANVLKYRFGDSSWIAVRPSGTEPKIKVYYCMRGATEAEAARRKDAAAACVGKFTAV